MFAAGGAQRYGAQRVHHATKRPQKFSSSFAQAPSGVMQEQVFETRLRDVYVRQLDGRRSREIRDLRYERATTIGVYVGITISIILDSHFSNTCERLELIEQCGRVRAESQSQKKSAR